MQPREGLEQVEWPGAGQWWIEVDEEPVAWAARCSDASDPLGEGQPWMLCRDEGAARALGSHLRARLGTPGLATGAMLTPRRWLDRLVPPSERPIEVDALVESELGRVLEAGIRQFPEQFPGLASRSAGAALPRALAELLGAKRQAGLDARSPGMLAALQALEPASLAQELVRAMGMAEGVLERLGWWDTQALSAGARQAWVADGRPWLVIDPGYLPQGVLDLLAQVALGAPVLWVLSRETAPDAPNPPDRRSCAWALAARWDGGAVGAAGHAAPALQVVRAESPADAAHAAVALAKGAPATVLVAADPAAWRPWLREACAREGVTLAGDLGARGVGPAAAWVRALVNAHARGLNAARAVDLLDTARRLRLGGWPVTGVDGVDARLRGRGAVRGTRAVLAAMGPEGGPLGRWLGALAEAPTAASALRLVAQAGIRQAGIHELAATQPIPGQAWAAEATRLAEILEGFADRVDALWQGPAAHTPELTARRVGEALREACRGREEGAAPPGGAHLELRALEAPLGPEVRAAVLLAPSEAELGGRAGALSLVPDVARRRASTLAHWPWAADRRHLRTRRAERLCRAPELGRLTVLVPRRDARGEDFRVWDRLAGLPAEELPPLRREPRLLPPPLRPGVRPAPPTPTPGPPRWSPSRVDRYRSCPRAYYFESVLEAEDRRPVGFDPERADRGSWVHGLLRALFADHDGWWREAPRVDRLEGWLAALAPSVEGAQGSAGASFADLQRSAHLHALAVNLAQHGEILAASPRLRPSRLEAGMQTVASPLEGPPLLFAGRLDRLDLVVGPGDAVEGCVVIDYKTGAPDGHAAGRPLAQRKVQLALYAKMAAATQGAPCLAALAVDVLSPRWVARGMVRSAHLDALGAFGLAVPEADRVTEQSFDSWQSDAVEEAARAARGVAGGEFPAAPADRASCERCPHRLYCPAVRR